MTFFESSSRSILGLSMISFGKPVSTFPDHALPRPEPRLDEQRLLRRGLRAPIMRLAFAAAAEFGSGVPAPARVVEHATGKRNHVGFTRCHNVFGLLRFR